MRSHVFCAWSQRLLLAAWMAGCAAGPAAPPAHPRAADASSRESGAESPEQSVRPGVNDRYFEQGAADTWTDIFEGESREVFRHRDDIVARLQLQPGMTVGDIGAGTGLFTLPIARAVGEDGQVLAIDIVPDFLERIEARAQAGGLDNVQTVLGGERATHVPDTSLDLAFVCNVYHHIEYPDAYMRSVLASLRPGAPLVVIDFERIEGVTSDRMLKHVRAPKETVIAEIKAAGFELVREEDFLEENYYLVFRRP
jgi:SAM-dependent methyltransferase